MKPSTRDFTGAPAVRERVPVLVGLSGPSGGGKTYSALRLATGIQQVVGGDIYFVDTENGRAKHYADDFKFIHVPFGAPFGSLDYLAAMQYCTRQGAKVIVVDSMSHEHEGPGGMLDMHETILTRLAGDDFKKRETMKMLAWAEPKQMRRQLINGMLQLDCNVICCFRAKDTAKPQRGANNKMEVVKMGFMPIAGPEFVFEMTLNCLLLPNANGVPTFFGNDLEEGEKMMIKLPKQFKRIFDRQGVQLTEDVGAQIAEWAAGNVATATKPAAGASSDERRQCTAAIAKLQHDHEGTAAAQAWAQWRMTKHGANKLRDIATPDLLELRDEFERLVAEHTKPAAAKSDEPPLTNCTTCGKEIVGDRPKLCPACELREKAEPEPDDDSDDPFADDQPALSMGA
jgi:ABC-type dipeptide/oligopeptide/nickel transport system ATPase subunit